MSLDLTLEVDSRLSRESAKSALAQCSAELVEAQASMSGVFSSGMTFLWRDASSDPVPMTESDEPLDWHIGSRMSFRVVASKYDECMGEVKRLLDLLARTSPAHFVLAFQYERVLALRDEKGLTYTG
jgi:hypothetical protein